LKHGDVLGVILAGGRSSRFGEDKAAAKLGDRRLIDHVAARAMPQVGQLALSGRDYGLNLPVIADTEQGQGPLGGVLSALAWAQKSGFAAVASFSCDAPFFPPDLVRGLSAAVRGAHRCSYASSRGIGHPVFGLWCISAATNLQSLFDGGVRSLKQAASLLDGMSVDFAQGHGPGGDMFFNINRPEDMLVARQWLAMRSGAVRPKDMESDLRKEGGSMQSIAAPPIGKCEIAPFCRNMI